MSVPATYLTVIFVWSTTPLGIVWSSESMDPAMASMLRMALAALLGMGLLRLMNIELPWQRQALHAYGYGVIGVFGAMYSSYLAAQFIPSGMISVFYGCAPVFSSLLAQRLLGEAAFRPLQWGALALALGGLVLVCSDRLLIEGNGLPGIALLLLSVFLFSFSGVKVKQQGAQIHPLAFSVGSMICSLPFYLAACIFSDASLPHLSLDNRSTLAVIYLAVVGSLLGFVSYYSLLRRQPAGTVAMVNLINPVFAICLGTLLNGEQLGLRLIIGSAIILSALLIFQLRR